ncbi:MAG: monovalent cation/H+ antiporter subunit D family protein [Planctomycetota bacterium]
MNEHLPALAILLPLLSAPFCILVRRRNVALALIIAVCWATFAMTAQLLYRVRVDGPVTYELGGWNAPYGIEYHIDLLSAFVMTFVSGMAAIVASYAPRSIALELDTRQVYLFCTVFLLCMAGLMGIAATGDLFNLFVFIEISSLSTYAMISLGRRRRALMATFQYLIVGTIGATFILIGIGLLYIVTGTLNMGDLAHRLQALDTNRTTLVAFGFLTVGVALKMALFPLHFWLPDAYANAPSAVTSFIASTSTKVSVYVLIRLIYTIFGTGFAYRAEALDAILLPLALLGGLVASLIACYQTDLKRLLAFSSVAQVSYMALGISLGNVAGLSGAIVHLFNHAITKGAMFLAVGAIVFRVRSSRFVDLRGIGRRMPVTSACMVIGGLSLIGVPGTAGFVSKWFLVQGAIDRDLWPAAITLLGSSLLAVVYVWKFVETAYLGRPEEETLRDEAPGPLLVPVLIVTAAILWFGFDSDWSAGIAESAARALLEQGS